MSTFHAPPERQRSGCWAGMALALIAVVTLTTRFVGLGVVPLIGDEAYYWLWSRHPDWSYYDHPAGVALLVRVSTALGGPTPWGIRWLNALTGAACVLLTWLVGRRFLSHQAGLFAAAIVAVGAPYLVTARFVYTNALTLCLVLLSLLAFWHLTRESAGVGAGVALGLSLALLFNAKYSGYVCAAAFVAALLLDHRHLLSAGRFWIAAGFAILGLVPVIVWNASHGWASFHWQLSHLLSGAVHNTTLLGSAHHAWVYLTGPLILLGVAGLGRVGTAAERLLTLVAFCLLIPVAASPGSSPRNLSTGLVPLLLLAGGRLPPDLTTGSRRAWAGFLAVLLVGCALFGVGTVAGLVGPTPLPQSSIVTAIRYDAAGWPALGAALAEGSEPIFALDYSIAAQIRYYTRQPAFTAWGQYRIWGIPSLQETTIVALDYVDPALVTQRLGDAYEQVAGPERLAFSAQDVIKVVHVWEARGLRWEQEVFLERFDFLKLLEEAR